VNFLTDLYVVFMDLRSGAQIRDLGGRGTRNRESSTKTGNPSPLLPMIFLDSNGGAHTE